MPTPPSDYADFLDDDAPKENSPEVNDWLSEEHPADQDFLTARIH